MLDTLCYVSHTTQSSLKHSWLTHPPALIPHYVSAALEGRHDVVQRERPHDHRPEPAAVKEKKNTAVSKSFATVWHQRRGQSTPHHRPTQSIPTQQFELFSISTPQRIHTDDLCSSWEYSQYPHGNVSARLMYTVVGIALNIHAAVDSHKWSIPGTAAGITPNILAPLLSLPNFPFSDRAHPTTPCAH